MFIVTVGVFLFLKGKIFNTFIFLKICRTKSGVMKRHILLFIFVLLLGFMVKGQGDSIVDTGNVQIGSLLWVDDLQFVGLSGIPIDIFPRLKVDAYPNQAKNLVNFELDEAVENAELIIYNSMDSVVLKKGCYGKNISVNTKSLVSGNYYFHLIFGNQRISSGSFIITK